MRATDAAGNVEALPPTFGWTIDTIAPDTAITVTPPDPSNSASATFEFTSNEGGASFRCELDGAGFSPCATRSPTRACRRQPHLPRPRARRGGNPDTTPASYTWFVDATAPGGGLTDPGSPAPRYRRPLGLPDRRRRGRARRRLPVFARRRRHVDVDRDRQLRPVHGLVGHHRHWATVSTTSASWSPTTRST